MFLMSQDGVVKQSFSIAIGYGIISLVGFVLVH